jgi:vitamin B12/bleomycin/antimicrobial peptide transport system ATP-binding/permease protein
VFSYLGKDFWNTLSEKDVAQFGIVMSKYVGALLVGAPVVTLYTYQRKQLSVHWREWMTVRTLDLYTRNRVYYNIERSTTIDNPDQRITEDVNR